MIKISKEEVLHIASLSRIEVAEHEIEQLIKDLEEVLTYAGRVQDIAAEAHEVVLKNINVFRDDLVTATDPDPIIQNAPQHEEQYFVVPVVLE
jgi:aspartyl-tRNA(Asn)/glutamyl-tRNA(Gln) amidotransferase subunit C